MSNIETQIIGTDIIVINDKLGGLITITNEDLCEQGLSNNFSYRVCPDGEILDSVADNNIDEKLKEAPVKSSKEILIEKLIKHGLEHVPEGLTELELNSILDFSEREIVRSNDYSKMFPFNVETINNGDLKVTLLMYNGSSRVTALTKFPFKLKDAKDKVITVGLIDINKTISPFKIGICEVRIEKASFSEKVPDLTTWTVTFEME
jgi:SLAP domain-containing protein